MKLNISAEIIKRLIRDYKFKEKSGICFTAFALK